MGKPKYKPGDRVLACVTVTRSDHEDSVFVESDSRKKCELKESDIRGVVLLRIMKGDRVRANIDNCWVNAEVMETAYGINPPQAWLKIDGSWPLRTVLIENLERE